MNFECLSLQLFLRISSLGIWRDLRFSFTVHSPIIFLGTLFCSHQEIKLISLICWFPNTSAMLLCVPGKACI